MGSRIIGILAGGCLCAAALVLAWSGTTTASGSQMKTFGIPEHGLYLIGPSDPAYEGLVTSLLKGQRDPLFESSRSFSAVLQNESSHSVVAYALTWELTDPNGRRTQKHRSFSSPYALLDGDQPRIAVRASQGFVVPSHSAKIVLPYSIIGGSTGTLSSSTGAMPEAFRLELEAFRGSADINLSLDGAFFDDGTFVGPNRSGFFELFKAQVDAEQDFLSDALRALSTAQGLEGVARDIENSLPADATGLVAVTPSEVYAQRRREVATSFLAIYRRMGPDMARGHLFEHWFRRRPLLAKRQHSSN